VAQLVGHERFGVDDIAAGGNAESGKIALETGPNCGRSRRDTVCGAPGAAGVAPPISAASPVRKNFIAWGALLCGKLHLLYEDMISAVVFMWRIGNCFSRISISRKNQPPWLEFDDYLRHRSGKKARLRKLLSRTMNLVRAELRAESRFVFRRKPAWVAFVKDSWDGLLASCVPR